MKAREWSYWTRNKLQILEDYLPAFNRAGSSVSQRIYIDLMSGQPDNVERHTKVKFDGSPKIALRADPGFTVLRFGEIGRKADLLQTALAEEFPGDDRYRVVKGDCNVTIDDTLADLRDIRWAPTFAFLDQQGAEIRWATIEKLAQFRRNNRNLKVEQWILMSPSMINREVRKSEAYRLRVTQLYGTSEWLHIQEALWQRQITASQYRAEMVNLMRHRLQNSLGYKFTQRIPMKMSTNKMEIFDMVFATDHEVGDKIMRHLYNEAAKREPEMMRRAKIAKEEKEQEDQGISGLFSTADLPGARSGASGSILWEPTPVWDPASRPWWPSG